MRYTQYRGLAQVSDWVKLKFAAMNLKNWPVGCGRRSFLQSHLYFFGLYTPETRLMLDA